ncbi:TonB-dependent receptor [Alteromonas sp. MMG017]|uniref:TonB-dependent receptor n=1 Tax=Alteromonas sp. MMG017 TaxID=2822692 RepID=UPI001B39D9E4|nr:TonB-dependent receptor [Alteromonas sp. MMG017]MBQ4829112.1 TonB-dependent receptor [Alteromonas sp. MMG017]
MKKTAIALAVCTAGFSPFLYAQDTASTEVITVIGEPLTLTSNAPVSASNNTEADYGDQLATLPGVTISRNGPVTGLVQYRGLYGDRVGVTIDGVDIAGAGPNAMDSPLSHVLPEPGLQAVLYRGIVPVSAGVETLGGKLDIRADAQHLFSQANGLQFNASASAYSPGNAQQYQANAFYGAANGFISGAFTHQQRDEREAGSNDAGSSIAIPNSQYQRNGGKLRAGYRWGKHSLDVSYQTLNTNNSGTAALAMDITFIDAAWYRLGYQYQASDDRTVKVKVFGNSNQHAMDNASQRAVSMASMARQNDADSVAQGIEATYITPALDGELEVGFSHLYSRNNSVITNPNNSAFYINNFSDITRDTYSGFTEWHRATDTADYLLGLRYTQIDMDADAIDSNMVMMNDAVAMLASNFNNAERSETYNMLDAAATIQIPVSDTVTVFTGISQKNRAPNYYERYTWLPLGITGGMADGFNYIGNLELDNETARQIEFGITYSENDWTVSPRLYYQDIEDYIAGTPSSNAAAIMFSTMMGSDTPFQWTNTDAIIKGLDVTVSGKLSSNLLLTSTASVSHGNRDDIDDALFRIAPEQLTTRIEWQSQLMQSPLMLSVTSHLVGAQNHTSALQNESSTAGYGLVHLGARWQLSQGFSVLAQLQNAFDKYYTAHTAGVNRVSNADIAVGDKLPGTGREWQVSMSYRF